MGWSNQNNSAMLPVKIIVAAQVLQFHSLDLIVVQMKLIQTVWKIL